MLPRDHDGQFQIAALHGVAISDARKSTVEASMVSSLAAEARASPESFRTTRRTVMTYPPMTTWANAVIDALPKYWAMDCFSSFT